MHLRRALLLFAIVLALAAVAASISRPGDDADRGADPPRIPPTTESQRAPTLTPGAEAPSEPAVRVVFAAGRDQTHRIHEAQAATILVEADEPGHVDIPGLGVTAPAEPLTPARFDVLASASGRYEIVFNPAGEDLATPAGTLIVRPPEE